MTTPPLDDSAATYDEQFPSVYLPLLQPFPINNIIRISLERLSRQYLPVAVIVDLTKLELEEVDISTEVAVAERGHVEPDDTFELTFARSFLTRLITQAVLRLAILEGEVEESMDEIREKTLHEEESYGRYEVARLELESIVELASALNNTMASPSSAGSSTQSFRLPFRSSASSLLSTISITLRDTTLLSNSTGHRTWASAPLLARLIGLLPEWYLPAGTTTRVLELGSGTGLLGFMIAEILQKLKRTATIEMTDYDPIVLDNLRFNSSLNNKSAIVIRHLDWAQFRHTDQISSHDNSTRFDSIFAADVVFEPEHVDLLYFTALTLLRIPNQPNLQHSPLFHLVLPLRSTHSAETMAFDLKFSGAGECIVIDGRELRLVTKRKRKFLSDDTFGMAGSERRGYLIYEIGWNNRD